MAEKLGNEEFIQLFSQNQRRVYGYIRSLVRADHDADDIFQETNMVLWRKCGDFTPGTNFTAWAFRIAKFQVLAHLKRRKRDRLRFDGDLIDLLAADAVDKAVEGDGRHRALEECVEELPDHNRALIEMRYQPDARVDEIAKRLERSASSVSVTLHRIRRALLNCIEKRLAGGAA